MTSTSTRTPIHLWIVGVLSLLWNAFGGFDYIATHMKLESYMSSFTPEQLEYFYSFPIWATCGWALGVWGAVAGSVALLLRKSWAVWAFGISILGLVISFIYNFVVSNGAEVMGTAGVVITGIIWVIAILLLVYSRRQAQRGVLT